MRASILQRCVYYNTISNNKRKPTLTSETTKTASSNSKLQQTRLTVTNDNNKTAASNDINSMGTINDDIKVKSNQIQLQATVIVRSTRTRTPTARIKWDYHKITSNDINSNNINSKINSNDNSNNNISIKNIPNNDNINSCINKVTSNDHTNSSINNITSNNNRNNYRSNNNITSNEKSNNRRIKNITGDNIINSSNNNITTNDKCNNKNINNSSSVLFVVVVDESVKRKANVSQ